MGGPADDTRNRKDRGVQLHRDAQHVIHKAGVEVHVRRDALINMALLGNDLRSQPLDRVVILKVAAAALGVGQLVDKALEHHRARVAQRVDRMAHAVDQALLVERLAVHNAAQIISHGLLVQRVGDVGADVVHHLHDLDVRAAVLGALQAGKRRRDDGVGVRPGRGDDAGREGRVVAAAVLHVQQQCNVQHVGLEVGVLLVGTQHLQQVFRRGQARVGAVDVHAAAALIVIVGVVAVDRQHRENADELDALFQLGLQVGLADVVIVAGQRQHAAGQRVHQVVTGGLHDDVAHKVCRQVAAFGKAGGEALELLFVRQVAEQQQIGRALKRIALAAQTADQVIDVVAAVPELALAGNLLAVALLKGVDAGNVRDARQHALAVFVAQTALDVVLGKQRGIDAVVGDTFLGKNAGFLFNGCVVAHGDGLPFPFLSVCGKHFVAAAGYSTNRITYKSIIHGNWTVCQTKFL